MHAFGSAAECGGMFVNFGHFRPQRPRHSGFEWICKHNRLRPEPIRFVRIDPEHAQSDGKSVNRGLPLLDKARGGDSWC